MSLPDSPSPRPLPRAHALGRRAEQAVADYLLARGFVILERNLRVGKLEIDLLARHEDLIAVVEVRCRSLQSWQSPFESVGPAKRQRIRRAGELVWQRRFSHDPSVNRMRFDVASVEFGPNDLPIIEYAVAVL